MNWPRINRQPLRTVSIPKLSGGLNMRDSKTLINDNQLTECSNMWYHDGTLKTRPGLSSNENMSFSVAGKGNSSGKALDIFMEKNKKIYRLYHQIHSSVDSEEALIWISETDIISLPYVIDASGSHENISFVTQFDNKIYVYTESYKLYTMEINPSVSSENYIWTELKEENYYVPTLVTNYTFSGKGTMIEGYNLIGNRYKMECTTVDRDLLGGDDTRKHKMRHKLFYTPELNSTITAKLTIFKNANDNISTTTYEHSVKINSNTDYNYETKAQDDGLRMRVYKKYVSFIDAENKAVYVTLDDYIENNLVITATYSKSTNNLNKVFGMRETVWFGSDALGISGGTRLFLGRNKNSKEKSLVLWSGLNEPTYFPQNCYAYVGDSNQKVNAFGKQNDSLIIFKDREIFYTRYTRNDDITATDLINQSIIDYTASNVYFPMVQLHSTIGCDCPKSIQLCRNSLVWADSGGKVYTLMTQNQFSERNVYCLSEMIEPLLKENGVIDASSADYNGHYFLFSNINVYVMDYESYGFINASSYSKSEDAQIRIPWWHWNVCDNEFLNCLDGFTIGDKLCCIFQNIEFSIENPFYAAVFDDALSFDNVYKADLNNENNTVNFTFKNQPIFSAFQTKMFDFMFPHNIKNVSLVNINFGKNGGKPIKVNFINEHGTDDLGKIYIIGNKNLKNKQFRPKSQFISRLGLRAECEGNMSIDSISLDYKILGGAK